MVDRSKNYYKIGHVSKEDYEAALSGYQAAADAMKSPQREAADAYYLSSINYVLRSPFERRMREEML